MQHRVELRGLQHRRPKFLEKFLKSLYAGYVPQAEGPDVSSCPSVTELYPLRSGSLNEIVETRYHLFYDSDLILSRPLVYGNYMRRDSSPPSSTWYLYCSPPRSLASTRRKHQWHAESLAMVSMDNYGFPCLRHGG